MSGLNKQAESMGVELKDFDPKKLNKRGFFYKGDQIEETEDTIEKAKNPLHKKVITDKRGKRTTVWVRNEKYKPKTKLTDADAKKMAKERDKKREGEEFSFITDRILTKLYEDEDISENPKEHLAITNKIEKFRKLNPKVKIDSKFINVVSNLDQKHEYNKLKGFTAIIQAVNGFGDIQDWE